MCSSLTVIGTFHSSELARVVTVWTSDISSHTPLCPNELLKKKKLQHEFCLLPSLSALLETPASTHPPAPRIHINRQPELAACRMRIGITRAPSVKQGDQEPCGQSKASVSLPPTTVLWLPGLSKLQVSSQTLPLCL